MKSFLVIAITLLAVGATYAQKKAIVEGHVLSASGSHLADAAVMLAERSSLRATISTTTDKNGAFRIETSEVGYFDMLVVAPYHTLQSKPVILSSGRTISAEVRLETNAKPTNVIDSVGVVGSFNDYDFGSNLKMKELPNGTFQASLPLEEGVVRYQVLVYKKGGNPETLHSVNGTMNSSFEYDDGGDYRSVLVGKGQSVSVVFDPSKQPSSAEQGSFEFASELDGKVAAELAKNMLIMQKVMRVTRVDRSDEVAVAKAKDSVKAWQAKLEVDLQSYTETPLYEIALARYLVVKSISTTTLSTVPDDATVDLIVSKAGPNSIIWSFDASLLGPITEATEARPEIWSYVDDLLENCVTRRAVPGLYFNAMWVARDRGDTARVTRYYYAALKEFPKDQTMMYIAKEFNPNASVKAGNQVPEFSLENIDSPGTMITPASLEGKYVLIDLWATWCGPCVMELPNLQKVYEEFRGKNFEVLSISLDQSIEPIAPFRKKRFSMPWLHAFTAGVFESPAAQLFETSGIPKPILIDPSGKIIAVNQGLRGETLKATLSTYIK